MGKTSEISTGKKLTGKKVSEISTREKIDRKKDKLNIGGNNTLTIEKTSKITAREINRHKK